MNKEQRDQIVAIIDEVDDMTIATIREDGFPQATTVSYMNEGLTIYFGTSEDSQKTKNIDRNNKVSITINRDYDSWDEIEGLSIGARAVRVTDSTEQERVAELMFKKFPQISQYEQLERGDACLVPPRTDSHLPTRLSAKRFGHTELVTLAAA